MLLLPLRATYTEVAVGPAAQNGAYIAHLKTWEDVPGVPAASPDAKKPRYILLTVLTDGRCKLHKSKRNANGTFSIGKTWDVQELKGLEVHVCC